MASLTAGTTFTDGVANDVTAAKLGALVTAATPTSGLIQDRTAETVVGTDDTILIGDASDSNNLKRMTVANLLKAPLVSTSGTIDNLTTGTTTSTAQIVTSGTTATFNSTTGTINTLTAGTTNSTSATIQNLTSGTTTSTNANITNGTVQTLTASTLSGVLTGGTYTGSVGTSCNFTAGTIGTLNSTTGTITNLRSTTGTIGNLSTTLAGDFTISQGTATLSTTGATAGTYGTTGIIPTISVDAKGRITTIGTASGGKILQVVEATYSTQVSTSSTSHSDTGLSASITPSSASNKIIVLVNQNYYVTRSATNAGHAVKLVRTIGTNSSDITTTPSGYDSGFVVASGSGASSTALAGYVTIAALDSPSTTSQCTYKTQGRIYQIGSSPIVYYQEASSPSRIILAEVAP